MRMKPVYCIECYETSKPKYSNTSYIIDFRDIKKSLLKQNLRHIEISHITSLKRQKSDVAVCNVPVLF